MLVVEDFDPRESGFVYFDEKYKEKYIYDVNETVIRFFYARITYLLIEGGIIDCVDPNYVLLKSTNDDEQTRIFKNRFFLNLKKKDRELVVGYGYEVSNKIYEINKEKIISYNIDCIKHFGELDIPISDFIKRDRYKILYMKDRIRYAGIYSNGVANSKLFAKKSITDDFIENLKVKLRLYKLSQL